MILSLKASTTGLVILVNASTSESLAFIKIFLTPCNTGSNDLANGSKTFFLNIPYKKSLNSIAFNFNGWAKVKLNQLAAFVNSPPYL